jgi:hypothetical protein
MPMIDCFAGLLPISRQRESGVVEALRYRQHNPKVTRRHPEAQRRRGTAQPVRFYPNLCKLY